MNEKYYDKKQAQNYLSRLDTNANSFCFQTFDDDQDRKDRSLTGTFYGTLDEYWEQLCSLSKMGAGVYVTVNKTDDKGRKKENIIAVRALWRENDDGDTSILPLMPQMIVESSPGKYHEYMLTEEIAFSVHRQAQEVLADDYGSDKNAKDLPRVLRLPGFPHQKKSQRKGLKGEPFMVRVVDTNELGRYNEQQIKTAFNLTGEPDNNEQFIEPMSSSDDEFTVDENDLSPTQVADLREALTYLDADDREEWVKVGQNLKKSGEKGFNLWVEWAQKSDKFDFSDTHFRWRGFEGSHSGFRAIFKRAMQSGWPNKSQTGPVSELVREISSQLLAVINQKISFEQLHKVINEKVVGEILSSVLWQPQKSKFLLMSQTQRFKVASEKDIGTFFNAEYGSFYDKQALDKLCDEVLSEKINAGLSLSSAMPQKTKHAAHKKFLEALVDYLKVNNQRPKIEFKSDPFINKNYVDFSDPDKAVFVFLSQVEVYELRQGFSVHDFDRVIAEYKSHFPALDEFLEFLVASRFAVDRKRSYLWMNCPSDWGKGFLLGALNELKYSVSLSEKELDKLLGGDPVGRVPSEFIDQFVVVFDECKRVTGNHKLLQSYIPCTPKHEMTVEVPLYAKLFLSAEHIYSLAGELGVEAQFANRFSLMTFSGTLSELAIFNELGNSNYHHACKVYISKFIEHEMQRYRDIGRHESAKRAEVYLKQFHDKYGLANTHELLDASIDEIASEINESIQRFVYAKYNYSMTESVPESVRRILDACLIKTDTDKLILRRSHTVVRAYIDAVMDKTSGKMISYKAKHIAEQFGQAKTIRCEVGGKLKVIKGIDMTEQLSLDTPELIST